MNDRENGQALSNTYTDDEQYLDIEDVSCILYRSISRCSAEKGDSEFLRSVTLRQYLRGKKMVQRLSSVNICQQVTYSITGRRSSVEIEMTVFTHAAKYVCCLFFALLSRNTFSL